MVQVLLSTTAYALHSLVERYPALDFHQPSQRLVAAVPNEKVLVMWDLKTGTRLMSFEGHKHAISAVAFHSGGKRLASFSLKESVLRVWEMSTNFFGLFGSKGKCIKLVSLEPLARRLSMGRYLQYMKLRWQEEDTVILVQRDEEDSTLIDVRSKKTIKRRKNKS